MRDLSGDDDAFDGVAVQPDGKVLVSGTDGLLRLDAGGMPDPSFVVPGVSGRVLLQPDGRIVVLGRDALTRLRANGNLDTGFGQGGVAAFVDAFRAAGSQVRAIARQPNGKLVAGGVIANQLALARWDSLGDLDRGFGDDGLVVTAAAPAGSGAEAITATPDGLVVVGSARLDQSVRTVRFLVARYLADGHLDPSFGSGGIVTASVGRWCEKSRTMARAACVSTSAPGRAAGTPWSPPSH